MSKKIYVIFGGSRDFSWIEGAKSSPTLEESDALLLTGGGDVHPMYYGGMNGLKYTWYGKEEKPGNRCMAENHTIGEAISLGIPIIGICRGLQWICVKAGGALVQNVTGHTHSGGVIVDGKRYIANSLHHQLIYPWALPQNEGIGGIPEKDYFIIGTIGSPTSYEYIINGDRFESIPSEIEIAYFKNIKGFGTQFHPEMMTFGGKAAKETLDMLNEKLYETIWKK